MVIPRILLAGLILAGTAVPRLDAQARSVILVRHAEKVDASRDPELSATGMARAIALAEFLADEPLDAVIVSQYQRTRMTAAPLARIRDIPIVEVAVQGSAASYADAVATVIDTFPTDASVLVVGHSNTLAPLIARLGGRTMPDLCDGEYARLFVVDRADGRTRLMERRYGRPDPASADDCRRDMRVGATTRPAPPSNGAPDAMTTAALTDLVGDWTGDNKLWLMPGDPVRESAATARVELAAGGRYLVLRYTWAEGGKPQDGIMVVRLAADSHEADIAWTDSWHQGAYLMRLAGTEKSPTTVSALGSYPAGEGPDWGWRIAVTAESTDRFAMRMWNIKPGGPEMLAVEATYTRK